MKKFLTVLLALSVVFTYSFSAVGTAFASTADDETKAYEYAKTKAEATVNLISLNEKSNYSGSALTYAKEEATKVATYNVVVDLIAVLKAQNNFTYANFQAEYDKWAVVAAGGTTPTYIGVNTKVGTVDYNMAYAENSLSALFTKYAASKEFDGRIADAKAVLGNIKTDDYSTKTYTVKENGVDVDYTYRSYAEKLIKDANDALDDLTAASILSLPDGTSVWKGTGYNTSTDYKDAIAAILYGYTYNYTIYSSSNTALYPHGYYGALTQAFSSTDKVKTLPTTDVIATQAKPNGTIAGVIGKLSTLLTVEDEPSSDEKDQIDLDHAKSDFAYYAKVTYYDTVKVAAEDDVTTGRANGYTYNVATGEIAGVKVKDPTDITKAEAAAINAAILNDLNDTVEVVNVYLENVDDPAQKEAALKANKGTKFESNVIKKALASKDAYEAAEKVAANMKAAVDFDGAKKYADADVDAALAKDKVDIYSHFNTAKYTYKNYLGQVAVLTDDVAVARQDAVDKFIDAIVLSGADKTAEADKKYCKNYYYTGAADDYDVIKAETLAALKDAKTVAEINDIMAKADERLAELRTKADDTAALAAAIAKYQAALEEYATEQCNLLNQKDTISTKIYRPTSFLDKTSAATTSALEDGFDILDAVKSIADLPAAYEEAKALFKDIKTDADLKAEASKVTALLGALPAVPAADLSDEDKYIEAMEAYDAYLANYGAEKADVAGSLVFDKKVDTLKAYQIKAITAAINDLPTAIDLEDKAAVEAIRTQLEKYLELYGVNSATYDGVDDIYGSDFNITAAKYAVLTAAEKAISNAEVNAVAKQIMKLNENSTAAEIKAAMEAYDALSGSEQQAVRDVLGQAFMYKLEIVQKAQVKAVEALKITASSVAKKGSITVKWTVKGDTSVADGFQVYRSLKMNSGFGTKAFFTTTDNTKRTYKNTKSLKKGTRYYYKIRAYKVVDGKTYYSDWSNKAYRIAK